MESLQFFPVLVVSFAISLGLTPISRQIAMRLGVVDKPNYRKIHSDHKPLMGGLAIYAAFVISLILFRPETDTAELNAILVSITIIAGMGLLDDRFGLSVRLRLIVTGIAAFIVVASGVEMQFYWRFNVSNFLLTVFWIMAIINAVNFLDNMDGLSSGLSSIAAFFFLMIALNNGNVFASMLAAALLGAAVGFLSYNFAPAASFMGDMGSLTLGFSLAVIAIESDLIVRPFSPDFFVPLLVLALPAFDINLVILTRIYERRSIGKASKDHTSHRLLAAGLTQRQSAFVLYSACVFFGAVGFTVSQLENFQLAYSIVGVMVVLVVGFYMLMFIIRNKYQQILPEERKEKQPIT